MSRLLQDIDTLKTQLVTICPHQYSHLHPLMTKIDSLHTLSHGDQVQLKNTLRRTIKAMEDHQMKKQKQQKTDLECFIERQQRLNKANIRVVCLVMPIRPQGTPDGLDMRVDLLAMTNQELCGLSLQIMNTLDVLTGLGIDSLKMGALVESISGEYNVIPYHNFTHGFSVLRLVARCILRSRVMRDHFSGVEVLAGLLCSLSHDMNHRGLNNDYHNRRESDKAVLYSGQSVLEHMHSARFFQLIQDPTLNILAGLNKEQQARFKDLLLSGILATDMSRHQAMVQKLTEMLHCNSLLHRDMPGAIRSILQDKSLDLARPCKRKFLLNNLVHAADIGNATMSYDHFMSWSYLLAQEFQDQFDKEIRSGLPGTQMMAFRDEASFYRGQIYFVKELVLPIWTKLGEVCPGLGEEKQVKEVLAELQKAL